jgi:hypothetical protein
MAKRDTSAVRPPSEEREGHSTTPQGGPIVLSMHGDAGNRLAYQLLALELSCEPLLLLQRFVIQRNLDPLEQVQQLRQLPGAMPMIRQCCAGVAKALQKDGAKWLDSVTHPCSDGTSRAVQVRLAVKRLDTLSLRLHLFTEYPLQYNPKVLDDAVAESANLGRFKAEMLAILENGSGVPPVDADGQQELENTGHVSKPGGLTRKELIEEAGDDVLSATVFDRIRKAAGLPPGERGGKGQQRRFSNSDVRKLIKAVEAGTYRAKKDIAAAWRQLSAK